MKIITVTNQKGGIGKSTTVQTIGAGFSQAGKKVLLIDFDSQSNLTKACGATNTELSICDVIMEKCPVSEATVNLTDKLWIIPSTPMLAETATRLDSLKAGKEYRLSESIAKVKAKYDYVIIDTPPSLSVLTINALTAATDVIIPANADSFSLDAVNEIVNTINVVKKYANPKLKIDGILLTRFKDRTILSKNVSGIMEKMASELGTRVFKTKIRESVNVSEAQILQKDLFTYNKNCNVAIDYKNLIKELEGIYNG